MAQDSASPANRTAPSGPLSPFVRFGRQLRRWDAHGRLTIAGLALVAIVGIGGAVWGGVIADPEVHVQHLDAGPVRGFAIGEVVPYPDQNVYLLGIEDGRIRAIDGIVKDTGCAVRWDPADARTIAENTGHASGAYTDPCSGHVWTNAGNAFAGAKAPLRTFQIEYHTNDDGVQHVWVEVIGDRSGRP